MTPRRTRHDQWRRTKNGLRTCSLGGRGCRVRLFQTQEDGFYYRSVHQPGGAKDRCSLRTRDRSEADRLGKRLYALLLTGTSTRDRLRVQLGELTEAFVAESPMHRDNAARTRADRVHQVELLVSAVGAQRDVATLTENDVRQYEARRGQGGIARGDGRASQPVRQRAVQADIKLLKQMLRWACTRTVEGRQWLERSPLQYVPDGGEHDVRRPTATRERFELTRGAMRDLQRRYGDEVATATSEGERARAQGRQVSWVRAELALLLLAATGRRRGAIMGLRWSDFDFRSSRITWRAEHDKKRRRGDVPYPSELLHEVSDFQRRLRTVAGAVFPRLNDRERSAAPELLSE